ncbi:MAG TPA: autotransporter-associated beta strand repeat-containing protein, partial [Verrucomicrobiae bacterium]|nr:autotransporter-associated beta strand repeat-containing protein [Verrucomicrobiae bacterium]
NNHSSMFSGVLRNNAWGTGPVGLTKVGSGTLSLTGPDDYSGASTVSNGELVISTAFIGAGNFFVNGGATLGVTNLSGASALVSNLTFAAGAALDFQNVSSASTPLATANNVQLGGSCAVKISGAGGLAANNRYPLIGYGGGLSGFTNLQLQMPYGWRGELAMDAGQVVLTNVAVVATDPPQLNAAFSNGLLQLGWPADHIGWRLQTQTNSLIAGLGSNWTDVANASSVDQLVLPVNPINGYVFYRLVYP